MNTFSLKVGDKITSRDNRLFLIEEVLLVKSNAGIVEFEVSGIWASGKNETFAPYELYTMFDL